MKTARSYILRPAGELKFSNQHQARRNDYPRAGGPLDNGQKASLCILAKSAYELQFTDMDFNIWRRLEQAKACGKSSLTECTQSDYLLLRGHFERLAGNEGEALRTENKHATQDKALAMFKLKEACNEGGVQLEYAAAICRNQNKCGLEQATYKQLWRLIFTIRNRKVIGKKNFTTKGTKHTKGELF